MTTDNDNRSKRCAKAIRNYSDDCDQQSNLIDFLTDARHWCDRNQLCFGDLDRQAYQHYQAELSNEWKK